MVGQHNCRYRVRTSTHAESNKFSNHVSSGEKPEATRASLSMRIFHTLTLKVVHMRPKARHVCLVQIWMAGTGWEIGLQCWRYRPTVKGLHLFLVTHLLISTCHGISWSSFLTVCRGMQNILFPFSKCTTSLCNELLKYTNKISLCDETWPSPSMELINDAQASSLFASVQVPGTLPVHYTTAVMLHYAH